MTTHSSSNRWTNRAFVRDWDRKPPNRLKAEQLDILVAVVKESWRTGSRILDLGCGTGKTEKLILRHVPDARFVCVDRSVAMLELARKRLASHAGQCRFLTHDLAQIQALDLAERPFRFILLVDTVHELSDPAKRRLFRFCRAHLAERGLLLILDRIALDLSSLRPAHLAVLRRLQRVTRSSTGQLSKTFADPRAKDHEHPLHLERYLRMLGSAGLTPALLHLHFHKVLLAATPASARR